LLVIFQRRYFRIRRLVIRRIFQDQTVATGILLPPVLANGFRGVIQPIRVSQQGDQFDGAKIFHRVGFRLAERPQFPRTGENGDIIRRAVQQLAPAPALDFQPTGLTP